MLLHRPFRSLGTELREQAGERGGSGSGDFGKTDESADGGEQLIVLLDDILARVPTRCLLPGLHDPDLELRFLVDELCGGMARGQAEVRVSRLAEICPEVFQMPLSPLEDVAIRLPLRKLLEQVGFVETPRDGGRGRKAHPEKVASVIWAPFQPKRFEAALAKGARPEPITAPETRAAEQPAAALVVAPPDADISKTPNGQDAGIEETDGVATPRAELINPVAPVRDSTSGAPPTADPNPVKMIIDPEKFCSLTDGSLSLSSLQALLYPEEQPAPKPLETNQGASGIAAEATTTTVKPSAGETAPIEAMAAEPEAISTAAAPLQAKLQEMVGVELSASPEIAASKSGEPQPAKEVTSIPNGEELSATTEPATGEIPLQARSLEKVGAEVLVPAEIAPPQSIEPPSIKDATNVVIAAAPAQTVVASTPPETTSPVKATPTDGSGQPEESALPSKPEKAATLTTEPRPTVIDLPAVTVVAEGASSKPSFYALAAKKVPSPLDPPSKIETPVPPAVLEEPPKNVPGNQAPASPPSLPPEPETPAPVPSQRDYRAPLEPVQMPAVRLPKLRPPIFVRTDEALLPEIAAQAAVPTQPKTAPEPEMPKDQPVAESQPAPVNQIILHPPRFLRKEPREKLEPAIAAKIEPPPPAVKSDVEAAVVALRRNQDPLQDAIAQESLDLPKIARLVSDLLGIDGCLLSLGEAVAESGTWPKQLGAAALRNVSKRLTTAAVALGPVAARAITLHLEDRCLTFFLRPRLSFGVAHAPCGFDPGVYEKLSAVADGLAGGATEA